VRKIIASWCCNRKIPGERLHRSDLQIVVIAVDRSMMAVRRSKSRAIPPIAPMNRPFKSSVLFKLEMTAVPLLRRVTPPRRKYSVPFTVSLTF
jgi:hypothetical protein